MEIVFNTSILPLHSGAWEIVKRLIWEPTGPTMRWTHAKTLLISPQASRVAVIHTGILGLWEFVSVQSQGPATKNKQTRA